MVSCLRGEFATLPVRVRAVTQLHRHNFSIKYAATIVAARQRLKAPSTGFETTEHVHSGSDIS